MWGIGSPRRSGTGVGQGRGAHGLIAFADRHLGVLWSLALFLPLAAVFSALMWLVRAKGSTVALYALVPALTITVALSSAATRPLEERVRARRRERFLVGREHLSDEAFTAATVSADRAAAALAVTARQVMGRMCGVPAECILPADDMEVLWSMADELGDGDTVAELMAHVSEEVGVQFRPWGRLDRATTFGELAAVLPDWVSRHRTG